MTAKRRRGPQGAVEWATLGGALACAALGRWTIGGFLMAWLGVVVGFNNRAGR